METTLKIPPSLTDNAYKSSNPLIMNNNLNDFTVGKRSIYNTNLGPLSHLRTLRALTFR